MNRDRNVEWLPTLREMLETEKDRLSILMNLCAQYALSSRVNAWDGADYELIDTLKLLMPVIDEAGKAADDMERYLATNHILLMIWKYFAEIIDEIEKNSTENEEQKPEQEEREGQKENPNESEEEPEEEKQGNTGAQTEQNEDKIRKEDTEQESETEDKTERNGEDQETEGHETGARQSFRSFYSNCVKIFRNVSGSLVASKTNRMNVASLPQKRKHPVIMPCKKSFMKWRKRCLMRRYRKKFSNIFKRN